MRAPREPDWTAVYEALADTPDGRERTVDLLRQYFSPVDWIGKAGFTGSCFETFDGGGDSDGVRDRFTNADLTAVTMLGVHIPARAAVVLTDDSAAAFSELLADIPTGLAMEDVGDPMHVAVPACEQLYRRVDAITGLGQTKTSKLLARKRPRLVPVIDDVTWRALRKPNVIWEPLRHRLRKDGLASDLRSLAEGAAVPMHVSVLRVLDISLWMRHRRVSGERVPRRSRSGPGTA